MAKKAPTKKAPKKVKSTPEPTYPLVKNPDSRYPEYLIYKNDKETYLTRGAVKTLIQRKDMDPQRPIKVEIPEGSPLQGLTGGCKGC